MANKKLIICEGPDGTGKSTQAKILVEKYNARLIEQPSRDNLVWFLRKEAKENPDYTAFERQLLIAISHVTDSFTKFLGNENIVMDRSYLSGLVYGKLTGVDKAKMNLLTQVLATVYKNAAESHGYDVSIVFFLGSDRLDKPDNDIFESTLKWGHINEHYKHMYGELLRKEWSAFSKNEKILQIDSLLGTVTEISDRLAKALDADS